MNFRDIENWEESNLLSLPDEETDLYEYKSSKENLKSLGTKINKAASAFWNSGGGYFIAGVDDNGEIDGGISSQKGRQSIRDWADQVISTVQPGGQYAIKTIQPSSTSSKIKSGNVILVIAFKESGAGPHMAGDQKYYIRSGAHTNPAGHFIVEAIRARRGLEKPMLRGLVREYSLKAGVLELVILTVNNATAFDVKLNFEPLPKMFREQGSNFPIKIPVIDKQHPFSMELSIWGPASQDVFGEEPVNLQLFFKDFSGQEYYHSQIIDTHEGMTPITMGDRIDNKIRKTLEKIQKDINGFRKEWKRIATEFTKTDDRNGG